MSTQTRSVTLLRASRLPVFEIIVISLYAASAYADYQSVKVVAPTQSIANIHLVGDLDGHTTPWPHEEADRTGDEWDMVQKKGNQFVVSDRPFYVNGFNAYWLMILAVDQSTRGKVSDVFQQASSLGLTVCRAWAFNDGGWRALQKSPSVYDEEVFKGLDFVVSEARKYKIRLILSLVNNWDGYGGKSQYVKWGKKAGLNLTSSDDFFSDPTVKGYYKTHIKTVLGRVNIMTNITYKDDPTIFAWELMNEARCPSDPSGDKLQAWIQEMAVHVKSIDPVHLLEIGLEGFYGPSTPERVQLNPNAAAGRVGTDFVRNHGAFGIDFASAHVYPDAWISRTVDDSHIEFARTWMRKHVEDAEKTLRMPVVFGEFGVSAKDARYTPSFRDRFIGAVYGTLLDSTAKGGGGGGCLLWHLLPNGTDYMDDGYAVVLADSPTTSRLISLQSWRMQMFNSRCTWRCRWSCRKRGVVQWPAGHGEEK